MPRPIGSRGHAVRSAVFDALRRLGTSRFGPRATRFTRFVLAGLSNHGTDMERNGECWLLERVASLRPSVLFDVGANIGDWTGHARRAMPDVAIHVFEAMPDTYARMADELARHDGLVLNHLALGDGSSDHLDMWMPRDHTEATAVREAGGDGPAVSVPATSGDRYVAEHGIDHIDLLKIDVEGFEWEVLAGFVRTIAEGRVDVVQFEHTTWQAVPARRWLGDYVALFEQAGFVVGKLMPNHLDVHAYTYGDEQFPGANYVAVRRDSAAHELLVGSTGSA